jgi:predicted nucleic acid-binding protein
METESRGRQPFLIADSSGLISLTSERDRNHPHALRAAQQLEATQATILVPYDVYAETVNMVGKKQGHAKAHEVGRFLSETAPFLVIDSSPAARERALSHLCQRRREFRPGRRSKSRPVGSGALAGLRRLGAGFSGLLAVWGGSAVWPSGSVSRFG